MNEHAQQLGRIKSKAKARTSQENGKDNRPHTLKVAHFLTTYPYELVSNEWKDKFPVGYTKLGRVSTYNPDFYCKTTDMYIEVTTSKPNISEQRTRWTEAMRRGLKLKVFWWEGEDITERFLPKNN